MKKKNRGNTVARGKLNARDSDEKEWLNRIKVKKAKSNNIREIIIPDKQINVNF